MGWRNNILGHMSTAPVDGKPEREKGEGARQRWHKRRRTILKKLGELQDQRKSQKMDKKGGVMVSSWVDFPERRVRKGTGLIWSEAP